MKDSGNILFCGVGGQGILLASEITAYALMEVGYDVKKSEVHGMAQRGGSVVAHLRYGQKVYSPIIEFGTVDIEVAFEQLEAARYMPYLHPETKVIVNTQKIPPSSVARGIEEYPGWVLEEMRKKNLDLYPVDALNIANELGELRAVNMVLVGAMSAFLPVKEETFIKVIHDRVKKAFIEINIEAFKKGRGITG